MSTLKKNFPNSENSMVRVNSRNQKTAMMVLSYSDGSYVAMDLTGASPWELGDFLYRELPGRKDATRSFTRMIDQCWWSAIRSPWSEEHPELSMTFLNSRGSLYQATMSHLKIYESRDVLDRAMELRLTHEPDFSGIAFMMSLDGQWMVLDQSDPHTWDFLPLEDLIAEHAHAA